MGNQVNLCGRPVLRACRVAAVSFAPLVVVALAGALALSLAMLAGDDDADFAVLTMEEAAAFRGTQGSPWGCTTTSTYNGCFGTDFLCSDVLNPNACAAAVQREYSLNKPTYCSDWRPGGGICTSAGEVLCYTWSPCEWRYGGCRAAATGGGTSKMDSSTCDYTAPDPQSGQGTE